MLDFNLYYQVFILANDLKTLQLCYFMILFIDKLDNLLGTLVFVSY